MEKLILTICLLLVVLSGCSSTYQRQTEVVEEEYAPYTKVGTSRITDQAQSEETYIGDKPTKLRKVLPM
jgi:uncharacterized protein YceK